MPDLYRADASRWRKRKRKFSATVLLVFIVYSLACILCVCVRACAHVGGCIRTCMCACLCVCVHACVHACNMLRVYVNSPLQETQSASFTFEPGPTW